MARKFPFRPLRGEARREYEHKRDAMYNWIFFQSDRTRSDFVDLADYAKAVFSHSQPCPPPSVTVVVGAGSGILATPLGSSGTPVGWIRTHEGLRHGIASSLYEMFWILSFDTRNAFEVSVSGNDAAYFGVFHYSHMGTIVWADTMPVKDVNGIPDV